MAAIARRWKSLSRRVFFPLQTFFAAMFPDEAPASRRRRVPLLLEPLEDRTVMSASITGSIFHDLVANGTPDDGEPGVPGIVAYLDANNNGEQDNRTVVFENNVVNDFLALPSSVNAGQPNARVSKIDISGLPLKFSEISLSVDISRDNTGLVGTGATVNLVVALLSPAGVVYSTGSTLFTLPKNAGFSGVLDDDSAPIPSISSGTTLSGTFRPSQPFSQVDRLNTVTDPNGAWYLLLIPPTAGTAPNQVFGNLSDVTLQNWSLEFTVPEISTVSDSQGNFTFADVPEGQQNIRLAIPNSPAVQVVNVAPNQAVTDVNIGITPPPDLVGTSFSIEAPEDLDWGSTVTIHYTVRNQGLGAAGPFDVDLLLSADANITDADSLLETIPVPSLGAHEMHLGSIEVTLPGSPGNPPAGFGAVDLAYLGLMIDSGNTVAESNENNNANQGLGKDLQALASRGNRNLTNDAAAQHQPNLAVNPLDPSHLVLAYMDYSLQTNGFAGIRIQVSRDAGRTWTTSTLPLPAGFDEAAGYAKPVFDLNGNVFVAFMAATFHGTKPPLIFPDGTRDLSQPGNPLFRSYGLEASNGIFVSKLTFDPQGIMTIGSPVVVTSNVHTPGGPKVNFFDVLPDITVDTSTSANQNKIYVTWTRIYKAGAMPNVPAGGTGGTDILVGRSENGGTSFSPLTIINFNRSAAFDEGGGNNNFSKLTVDSTGRILLSFNSGGRFLVARSDNAGGAFTVAYEPFIPIPLNAAGQANSVFPDPELYSGYPLHNFPVRGILADPRATNTNVYFIDAIKVNQGLSTTANQFDRGDINFAWALKTSATAYAIRRVYQVGENAWNIEDVAPSNLRDFVVALNDDNNGRYLRFDDDRTDEVIATQAQPAMAIDSQGRLISIWLDNRRDPLGQMFDVFGSVSTDGGLSWSANFRVTEVSFNPEDGKFTDARGFLNAFFGDSITVVAAGGFVHAAWTDTRDGNQEIYYDRFPILPPEDAPNDRFEDNNTQEDATVLGPVSAQQRHNRLQITAGDEDWFRVTPQGERLFVSISGAAAGRLELDLLNAAGEVVASGLDLLDQAGQVIGKQIGTPVAAGQDFFVRVRGVAEFDPSVEYTLNLNALTTDLGERVFVEVEAALNAGARNIYALAAPVAGSMEVALDNFSEGTMVLQVIRADTLVVVGTVEAAAGQTGRLSIPVPAGQGLLLAVQGAGPTVSGEFILQAINLDQFQTSQRDSLFFTTFGTPKALAVGDFNDDGNLDVVGASTDLLNPISLVQGTASGLFWAARSYDAGAGSTGLAGGGFRGLVVDSFRGPDEGPDVAVSNFLSADVSVLLGLGDGTLGPEKRSDAVFNADSLASGDFNGDGIRDLAVLERTGQGGGASRVAILIGRADVNDPTRGDGTFLPPTQFSTGFTTGASVLLVGRFNADEVDDLVVFGNNSAAIEIYLGNGDGTFQAVLLVNGPEATAAAVAADVNDDGFTDLVTGGTNNGRVYLLLGNGDATFQEAQSFGANTAINRAATTNPGLVVMDVGGPDGFGTAPDGILDIVTVAIPRIGGEAPHINFLPGLQSDGVFSGFGAAQRVIAGLFTGPLVAAEVSGDGRLDLLAAEPNGFRVVYSQVPAIQPNTTPATAQDFGVLVHYVAPPRAIVPAVNDGPNFHDAWFKMTVPTEAVDGAGDQVIDFSALFTNEEGAGLFMEVLDADNNVIGRGERFRIRAAQGAELKIHIFGIPDEDGIRGAGVYQLVIDVLPQVVSVQATSAFTDQNGNVAGPATSLVITFQGDRLDPLTAEDPNNYRVTWLGADGQLGGGDDQVIALAQAVGSKPVVYNPGANTEISSGRTFPTSIRQTSTLLFDEPLPEGNYLIELTGAIQTAPFNTAEDTLLVPAPGINGQALVQLGPDAIAEGTILVVDNLVGPAGEIDFSSYSNGTAFLTQFHNDLGALLNRLQTELGDDPAVSQGILDQILARFVPAVAAMPTNFLIFWFDPVGIGVTDPGGARTTYDLPSSRVTNPRPNTFIEVGGNIEVIVMAGVQGLFNVNVSDVQTTARGGAVVVAPGLTQAITLTDSIRSGGRDFQIEVPALASSGPGSPDGTFTAPGGSILNARPVFDLLLTSVAANLLTLTVSDFGGTEGTLLEPGSSDIPGAVTGSFEATAARLEQMFVAAGQNLTGLLTVLQDAAVEALRSLGVEGVPIPEVVEGLIDTVASRGGQMRDMIRNFLIALGRAVPQNGPPVLGGEQEEEEVREEDTLLEAAAAREVETREDAPRVEQVEPAEERAAPLPGGFLAPDQLDPEDDAFLEAALTSVAAHTPANDVVLATALFAAGLLHGRPEAKTRETRKRQPGISRAR